MLFWSTLENCNNSVQKVRFCLVGIDCVLASNFSILFLRTITHKDARLHSTLGPIAYSTVSKS